MNVCVEGDYEAFRLLWSAREQPLSRDEFEVGWQAVTDIRIRALERAKLASTNDRGTPETHGVYAVYADVAFDPTHRTMQREPQRRVILLIVREHDSWHLARAPQDLRTWLADKVERPSADTPNPTLDVPTPEDSG